MAEDTTPRASRRSVLKLAGLASAAASAPVVAAAPAQAMRARPDQRAARMQDTDHIRKFYETNRR